MAKWSSGNYEKKYQKENYLKSKKKKKKEKKKPCDRLKEVNSISMALFTHKVLNILLFLPSPPMFFYLISPTKPQKGELEKWKHKIPNFIIQTNLKTPKPKETFKHLLSTLATRKQQKETKEEQKPLMGCCCCCCCSNLEAMITLWCGS